MALPPLIGWGNYLVWLLRQAGPRDSALVQRDGLQKPSHPFSTQRLWCRWAKDNPWATHWEKKRELFNWLGGKTTRLAVALPIFPSCGTYCRSCFLRKMKLVTPDDAHKLSSRDLEYPNFTAYVAMTIPRARSDRWQYGSRERDLFQSPLTRRVKNEMQLRQPASHSAINIWNHADKRKKKHNNCKLQFNYGVVPSDRGENTGWLSVRVRRWTAWWPRR